MRNRGIDAGGSCTRIGESEDKVFRFNSVCMEIPEAAPTKQHIITNPILDFVIRRAPLQSLVGRRFVKDEAMLQYTGQLRVCDNQTAKVLQEITYINVLYSIAADNMLRSLNDQDLRIGLCIPTAEYFDDENERIDRVKDGLAGETVIYFPLCDKTIRFTLARENILVAAEGVVAANRFRRNKAFVLYHSLIVDVGYRSTDITILDHMNPVGAAAGSRPIGGINFEAIIQMKLERDNVFVTPDRVQKALCSTYVWESDGSLTDITKYLDKARLEGTSDYAKRVVELALLDSYVVTEEDVKTAVKSAYIMQGKDVMDITAYVNEAKVVFVDSLFSHIRNVANAKLINLGDISNILCVGRPFNGDIEDEYNMINLLRAKFSEDIRVFSVPDSGLANVLEIINLLNSIAN